MKVKVGIQFPSRRWTLLPQKDKWQPNVPCSNRLCSPVPTQTCVSPRPPSRTNVLCTHTRNNDLTWSCTSTSYPQCWHPEGRWLFGSEWDKFNVCLFFFVLFFWRSVDFEEKFTTPPLNFHKEKEKRRREEKGERKNNTLIYAVPVV